MSALFVAARIITPEFVSNPSISVRSWLRVFSRSSFEENPTFFPLALPTASISSMNTMQGAFSLRLTEQVTDPGSTDTDEHLYEIRTGNREERNVGFPCHCLGQQCLSGTRRAYQKGSLRDFSSEGCIFLRILEEVHDLHHLFLGSVQTRDILECDVDASPCRRACRWIYRH